LTQETNNGLHPVFQESNQVLVIPEMTNGHKSRFSCLAKNKAGQISREFFVHTLCTFENFTKFLQITKKIYKFSAPPALAFGSDVKNLQVLAGSSLSIDCPITNPSDEYSIDWIKDGRFLQVYYYCNLLCYKCYIKC